MRTFLRLTIISIAFILILAAIISLKWKMVHDTPLFFYMAYIFDKWSLAPYADFFDVNPPGTHAFYYFFCKVFGYSDLGYRVGDLICLFLLLTLTYILMSEFSSVTAFLSPLLFGLVYFKSTEMALQRDFLTLIPISLAIVALFRCNPSGFVLGYLIGLLFGIASTIKPHVLLGLPCFFIFQLQEKFHSFSKDRMSVQGIGFLCLSYGLGLITPWLAVVVFLWCTSALSEFLDIATNYWPLYRDVTGDGQILTGTERLFYLISQTINMGGYGLLLVPAVLGGFVGLFKSKLESSERRKVWFLFSLMCVYTVYPAFGGKFWPYHYFPFVYFSLLLASLCTLELRDQKKWSTGFLYVFVLLVSFIPYSVSPSIIIGAIKTNDLKYNSSHDYRFVTSNRVVKKITKYLKSELRPEDTVQPLDWTGGALHAMMRAGAKPGTSFLYDEQFYHHTKNNQIKMLRRRFINELSQNKPRFIIEVMAGWPGHRGPASDAQFPELKSMLGTRYSVVVKGKDYKIYERR